VRTPTGFHIVRLDDTRGGDTGPQMVEQIHARHILMRPNEVQDDATTRQRLEAIRTRILAGEDFGALASVTAEDPGSASRGGDLDWNVPGTYDKQFADALVKLEKGKYTDTPVRTRFGYHIIMLEDVRPVKFPALNEVRQRISQQITQGRIEELVKSLRAKAKVE